MTDPLKTFLEHINNSGWIGQEEFKKIFSGVASTTFAKFVDYPLLFGDRVADIEVINIDGKISLNFNPDQDTSTRPSLNYVFPFVSRDPTRRAPGMFFIGSSAENQFIVPDYTVSKKHAVISKRRTGYYLKDLQSEFGSYVNGVSFGSKEILLSDGDHLSFGRYQFIFLEPKTCFELLYGKKTKRETRRVDSPGVTEDKLKQKLNETSLYVADCIARKSCEDVEEKLLTIISFIPFFNSFSLHEKKQILSYHKRLIVANEGETIVRQHDASDNFFIILKGRVAIVSEEGQVTLNSLGPGNSFGEIAFLTGTPRSVSVIAQESTIMFTIDREFYENIGMEIREKIKDQIIRQISANIVRQNREIKEFNKDRLFPETKTSRRKERHTDLADKKTTKKWIAAFINESPIFAKLTKYQKNGLVVILETVESYDAGEVIIKENTLHNGLNFILEGSVAITVTKGDVVLAELHAGDLFGEISTFGKKTTSANVIARGKVRIIRITADDMNIMPMEIREKIKDIILDQIIKRQAAQNNAIVGFSS
ncbi:MAG: cyclic nucleotide-binding domain-containing protein [Magnetococcales bacterium]|nr:cyclic nucleotide-binding domain-containing protein [Magnetococcales bacterium]MBF0150772.1 cyclic nucleotide-binding domain-containing protein [Magnetococcales bacterium]MBF0173288.1 cyclic nucleotide-binding domain-containing protein [Magnetococcales bacterium]MBF0630126.1 cyclic nucleotide-binding domain-containing protein [Magnetococcales bacterium]